MPRITLKAARVNRDLTQDALAEMIGVRRETIHNWENKRSFPNAKRVSDLCNALGVNYEDIEWRSE